MSKSRAAFALTLICALVAGCEKKEATKDTNVSASSATAPASQPAVRSVPRANTEPPEIYGIILKVDTTNNVMKLLIYDGGFKPNAAGKFPAVNVHWSGRTDMPEDTPSNLVGCKVRMAVTGDNTQLTASHVVEMWTLPGEPPITVGAIGGNQGATPLTPLGNLSSKLSAKRVKELDDKSELLK